MLLSRFNGGEVFATSEHSLCIVINQSSEINLNSIKSLIINIMDTLEHHIEGINNATMFASLSDGPVEMSACLKTYKEIKRLAKYIFFCTNERIISLHNALPENNFDANELKVHIKQIDEAFEKLHSDALEKSLNRVFAYIEKCCSFQSYSFFLNWIIYKCIAADTTTETQEDYATPAFAFQQYFCIKNAQISIINHVLKIVELKKDERFANPIIRNFLDFIQNHLEEDIDLKSAASNVHVSPAYLSRLISEQTGKSFTDHLNILRIEKAKKLMHNKNLKNYEIALQVGFSNPKYFNNVFKKYTGCSLKEFRAIEMQNSGLLKEKK